MFADDVAQQFFILKSDMAKFSKYGAIDTEPRNVVYDLIRKAFKGRNPKVPRTADAWELYSSMEGVEEVANQLGEQLKVVVDALGNLTLIEARKLKELPEFYFLED
jgi:L-alanine-DL-glutamate epimerase-like enolase superfamily enzyme